jgi:hypothetical protein
MSYLDRLVEGYQKILQNDWINALIQICINLDAIAKRHYGGRPGTRIKRYIRNNQFIITRIGMLHLEVHGDIIFQVAGGREMTFEEIAYKLIRCSLLHEGELDTRINITDTTSIGLDDEGNFLLSRKMIMAFFLLLVSDPKNSRIQWPSTASFTVEGTTVEFNNIKGNPTRLVDIFREISEERSNNSVH